MVRRDGAGGSRSRRPAAGAQRQVGDTQGIYPGLSELQAEILRVLRSAGGFLVMADLLFELRWRGAVRWQGTTKDAISDALDGLLQRGLLRARTNSGASYELTTAGWDASQRPA